MILIKHDLLNNGICGTDPDLNNYYLDFFNQDLSQNFVKRAPIITSGCPITTKQLYMVFE